MLQPIKPGAIDRLEPIIDETIRDLTLSQFRLIVVRSTHGGKYAT
jgi:hypothetical protein